MDLFISLLIMFSVLRTAGGLAGSSPKATNLKVAVLVPGFLTGADDFKGMVAKLNARGIPTVAVPMPNWHWLPCLGGRSVRPILERIDFTVQHVLAAGGM
jgi:hypothetical protein